MKQKKLSLIIISSIFLLFSCRKKIEEVSWNTQNIVPIVKSSLKMGDFLQEDSSIIVNNDKTISFVHEEYLDTLRPLDSLVKMAVDPFEQTVTINSLKLGDQRVGQKITLEEIITNAGFNTFIQDGAMLGAGFVNLLGNNIPNLDPINIDVSQYFETAVLREGKIKIFADNQLPFDITEMKLEIRNTVGNEILFSDTITNIKSKSISVREKDLATALNGQAIKGNLTVFISDIKAAASSSDNITINYADYVEVGFEFADLQVESATAIFPEQEIINHVDEVPLVGDHDFELTFAKIKSGGVYAKSTSTIQDTVYLTYVLPSATKDGKTFGFELEIPPSANGETVEIEKFFPFNGYDFKFTGLDGTKTNTFVTDLKGDIHRSEEVLSLSLLDTISVVIRVDKILPEYVEGYLGTEKFSTGEQSIPINMSDFLPDGDFELENINTSLIFKNSLGVDAKLSVSKLESINKSTNTTKVINSSNELSINSGTKSNNVYTSTTSTGTIENTTELINNRPDEIVFDFDVAINPSGNDNNYSDYAHTDNELITGIQIEAPLSINAKNFILEDTTDFLKESLTAPVGINEGTLSILASNYFPLGANFTVYFVDEELQVIDSLVSTSSIRAGIPNNSGKVDIPTSSQVDYLVPYTRLQNILSSKKAIFKVKLNTDGNDYYKIYDDYSLDFSIIGNFEYAVKGENLN